MQVHGRPPITRPSEYWIPAFAGMTSSKIEGEVICRELVRLPVPPFHSLSPIRYSLFAIRYSL
jgi:hypothetical protein